MKNRNLRTIALRSLTCCAVLFIFALSIYAQTGAPYAPKDFERTEKMITMRDGVRLYTNIYVPKNRHGSLPVTFSY